MEFVLGLSLAGATPSEAADMMCLGCVVRSQTDPNADMATLAATITKYSYLRKFLGKHV